MGRDGGILTYRVFFNKGGNEKMKLTIDWTGNMGFSSTTPTGAPN